MSETHISRRGVKRAVGALVLAALAAGAAMVSVGGKRAPVTNESLLGAARVLPGVADAIAFQFDNKSYSGQAGARVAGIDFVVKPGAPRDEILLSMKAMGSIATRTLEVYQRIVVTGYRSRKEYDAGLPFAARAILTTGEAAKPLSGWEVIRLPDEPVAPQDALSGIYSKPNIVSCAGGALKATVDLASERLARPAADWREILAAPLVDCFDYDDVFLRAPGLDSLDVTITDGGHEMARAAMTRKAFAATDVATLRAALAEKALSVSDREMSYAGKYDSSGLFTPLLYRDIVSKQDQAALAALEAERRAAEDEFYKALFAGGTLETFNAPAAKAENPAAKGGG